MGGICVNNELKAAIVFLPPEGESGSPMLQPVVFAPAALWCAGSLMKAGVARFLVVCRVTELEQAKPCFPEDTRFITTDLDSHQARESLKAFLSENGGDTIVLTKPVLFFRPDDFASNPQGGAASGAYRVESEALLQELGEEGDFADALARAGQGLDSRVRPLAHEEALWAENQRLGQELVSRYWMRRGVFILDPEHTYISPTVELESGTTILPGTILRGDTKIGAGCEIGPNAMLCDVTVGQRTTINASQANQCSIGSDTTVGPFAYIRPNTHVGDHVKVGDFVELKNSTIGDGTKISHLTYVGDSDVGKHINFGCGTVTVNYDGAKKFRTVIEDNAFIGCNTNLVAPVHVGQGAYIAAGSTITQEVPGDSLAIARARQTVKKQWAAKRRKQN